MIKITYLSLNLAFQVSDISSISFTLSKPGETEVSRNTKPTHKLDESIDFIIDVPEWYRNWPSIEICVHVGHICVAVGEVKLKKEFKEKKVVLGGNGSEFGYLICDYGKTLEKSGNEMSMKKMIKKSSSSSNSLSENKNIESMSGNESPFRKNKVSQPFEANSDKHLQIFDDCYHTIIEEQLFNQRAWNKIQENEIFQLRYKQRIEALIGKEGQ